MVVRLGDYADRIKPAIEPMISSGGVKQLVIQRLEPCYFSDGMIYPGPGYRLPDREDQNYFPGDKNFSWPEGPDWRSPSIQDAAKNAAVKGVFAQGIFDVLLKMRDMSDFDEASKNLAKYIKEHPDEASGATATSNIAPDLYTHFERNRQQPRVLESGLREIESAFDNASPAAHARFNHYIAQRLSSASLLLSYAADLEVRAVGMFTEKGFMDINRFDEEYIEKSEVAGGWPPTAAFIPERTRARFPAEMAAMFSTLGEIDWKLSRTDAADAAFSRSLKVHAYMEAYRGLSAIAQSRGDQSRAFDFLCDAFLTGRMPAIDITRLKQDFKAIKGGDEQAFETYLDDRYRKNFPSPLKVAKYQPPSRRTKRVALAELFTGAACEPCIPVDLCIEGGLERYSRDELAVVVYHDDAPLPDPLSNPATQERAQFYRTGGSTPHLFLDGKEAGVVADRSNLTAVFAAFSQMLDAHLFAAENADLAVTASRSGSQVTVVVSGNVPQAGLNHLQIALVEKEVSYSGENGLRFQPMVVRAMANQTKDSSGFPVTASGKIDVNFVFDLDAITAANLRYYDEYDAALKERTQGRAAARYREMKHNMNPSRLAVVAFLQDDSRMNVLQSAYAEVTKNPGHPSINDRSFGTG